MVVMRSKLFSFKTSSGEEFAVGPDAVITIFLRTVDRAIDRWRSINRQRLVFQSTRDIVYSPSVPDFLAASLAAYQNLSKEEKAELNKVIDEFAKKQDLDPQLKLMAMAFGFLNISGEDNYGDLMADLRAFLTRTTTTTVATPAPITFSAANQSVALSATVISSSAAVSEGTVTFTITSSSGATIGVAVTSGVIAGGATPATTYPFPGSTPAGSYSVKAVYNGTGKYTGSTGSSILTVNKASTTMACAAPAALTHNAAAQPVVLHATVSGPTGNVDEGTVTFSLTDAAGAAVGTPATSALVTSGAASATFTLPANTPRGTYTVKATYSGTANLASTNGTSNLTVN